MHQIHASLEPTNTNMFSIDNFAGDKFSYQDYQKYLLGGAGLAIIGAGAYWWYKNSINLGTEYKPQIDDPVIQHQKRTFEESSKNSEFQKFVQHFSPPANLSAYLVPYERILYEQATVFNRLQDSKFVAKSTDLTRLIIAQRMNNYIKKKNYTSIGVPQKYIFLTGDVWTVIAEKIDETKNKPTIGLQQMMELTDIIETTGYSDFDDKNLMSDKNGKIFFIDTEDKSFISPIGKYNFGIIPGSKLRDEDTIALCKEKYINLNYFNQYLGRYGYLQKEDARNFLMQKINQLKIKYENSEETYTKITGATDLDDYNVNINALSEYIKPLIQSTRGLRAKPRNYFKK